jgi:MFS family permease
MSALLSVSMVGLWAAAVYEPSAIAFLSGQAGMTTRDAAKMAARGIGLFSMGAIFGCIIEPWLAERIGRRSALAIYFFGMIISILLAFGWAFYLPTSTALPAFLGVQFFFGLFAVNSAIFSMWLPDAFGSKVSTIAFGFCTSTACFVGAGLNFGLAGAVAASRTLGAPIIITSIAFAIGLLIIPFATEGQPVSPE